jgi:hypothetical protein
VQHLRHGGGLHPFVAQRRVDVGGPGEQVGAELGQPGERTLGADPVQERVVVGPHLRGEQVCLSAGSARADRLVPPPARLRRLRSFLGERPA